MTTEAYQAVVATLKPHIDKAVTDGAAGNVKARTLLQCWVAYKADRTAENEKVVRDALADYLATR